MDNSDYVVMCYAHDYPSGASIMFGEERDINDMKLPFRGTYDQAKKLQEEYEVKFAGEATYKIFKLEEVK